MSSTPIHDILKHIEDKKLSKICDKKNLYNFFLKHCVINIIFRKQWKENMSRYDYGHFIHYSDEGFALLVLENNIIRYREMRDCPVEPNQQNEENEDEEDEHEYVYSQPIYTTLTKKGKQSPGKGWNDASKTQFKVYSKFVQQKRQNQLWMNNERHKSIKQRVLRDSNESNKCQKRNIVDNDKQMSTAEEMKLNQFIVVSINNTEWLKNVVRVWSM